MCEKEIDPHNGNHSLPSLDVCLCVIFLYSGLPNWLAYSNVDRCVIRPVSLNEIDENGKFGFTFPDGSQNISRQQCDKHFSIREFDYFLE